MTVSPGSRAEPPALDDASSGIFSRTWGEQRERERESGVIVVSKRR